MSITLNINGIEVRAEPGATVLEVARANDIYIPTLCYHPKLNPAGACRLCVVEIEQLRGFPTACTVPAADGMVVRTDSEALATLRRETLGLILSEHPYTCLVCRSGCDLYQMTVRKAAVTTGCQYCPSNGQCELQTLVDRLDMHEMCYPIAYRGLPVEHEDPFFDRDYNLCILCGRCIRMCQDVRHAGVLAFVNRGSHTIVGTAFGRSHLETDCQFCGACVDACPTGALYDKRGKWDGVPEGITSSVCPYCSVGCAVNLETSHDKVMRAVAIDDGPANDGQLCVRGRFGVVDVVHHLARIKAPLIRRRDRLIEVSWAEAEAFVAEGLAEVAGDAFAVLGTASATNEEAFLLQKFARATMGSSNVGMVGGPAELGPGGSALLGSSAGGPGDAATAGRSAGASADGVGRPLPDELLSGDGPAIRAIRDAACVIAIGTNAYDSHPIVGLEMRHARARGALLVAIDPRATKTTRGADIWLAPAPGSDHLLLAGLARALGRADLTDVDPGAVAAATGVSAAAIADAAAHLADCGPAIIVYGSGVTHQRAAADALAAVRAFAACLPGARILAVAGEGNQVGANDMGLHPAWLPGYASIDDSSARARFEAAWGVRLPAPPGLGYAGIVDGVRDGRIRALYLSGAVPPVAALDGLSFLVVQDVLPTEVTQHAHAVLPMATFAEQDGTMTNLEGRVQRLHRAVRPIGTARPGWAIARDLARALAGRPGAASAEQWAYADSGDVMAEIAGLVDAYREVDHRTLGVAGYRRRFASGAPLAAPGFARDGHVPLGSPEFPLALIVERDQHAYYGANLTEDVKGMNLLRREEVMHMSPVDASRLRVADGDLVRAVSAHGSAECLVEIDGGVPEGAVFASFSRVVGSPLFAHLTPASKACAIRIEPMEG